MTGWNFADMWERIATLHPDAVAQIETDGSGETRRYTWADFDRRADAIAATLTARGAVAGDKVAQYLYNCPEYLESTFALFKASLVPVNTNYRYTADELVYLWTNADAVAVIFHGAFAEQCDAVRGMLPMVTTWLWVDDGTGPCPRWATDYAAGAEAAVGAGTDEPSARSGDDLFILYTGGTTGMPKGVMWRQDDVFMALDASARVRLPDDVDWAAFDERLARPGPRNLPAAPLMHGTGAFSAMYNLTLAGTIVTSRVRRFDPEHLLDVITAHRINSMSIVGDAFAKPIVRALDTNRQRWDISSLRVIVSSGVMWAADTKAALRAHNARLVLVDTLGSSEAIGMATNTTDERADGPAGTAQFVAGPHTRVITDDGRHVQPGSGERGRVAIRGRTPVGYYKDPAKSADTFVIIDGVRWTIPGDWAEVAADGTITLFGRGSQCINTGGEKVFPEEVEEALKTHPLVDDAAVVGVPDDRFGQAVVALVETRGEPHPTRADLVAHVRLTLAAYKTPKHVIHVASVNRADNGKLDYRALTDHAATTIAALPCDA